MRRGDFMAAHASAHAVIARSGIRNVAIPWRTVNIYKQARRRAVGWARPSRPAPRRGSLTLAAVPCACSPGPAVAEPTRPYRVVPDLCAPRTRSGIHFDSLDSPRRQPRPGCAARRPRRSFEVAPNPTLGARLRDVSQSEEGGCLGAELCKPNVVFGGAGLRASAATHPYATFCILFAKSRPDVGGGRGLPSLW
jgi:hypothetical protein